MKIRATKWRYNNQANTEVELFGVWFKRLQIWENSVMILQKKAENTIGGIFEKPGSSMEDWSQNVIKT